MKGIAGEAACYNLQGIIRRLCKIHKPVLLTSVCAPSGLFLT